MFPNPGLLGGGTHAAMLTSATAAVVVGAAGDAVEYGSMRSGASGVMASAMGCGDDAAAEPPPPCVSRLCASAKSLRVERPHRFMSLCRERKGAGQTKRFRALAPIPW